VGRGRGKLIEAGMDTGKREGLGSNVYGDNYDVFRRGLKLKRNMRGM
jgi:hypothetical protein